MPVVGELKWKVGFVGVGMGLLLDAVILIRATTSYFKFYYYEFTQSLY